MASKPKPEKIPRPKIHGGLHLPCILAFICGIFGAVFYHEKIEVTVPRIDPDGQPSPETKIWYKTPFVQERLQELETFGHEVRQIWKDFYYDDVLKGERLKEEYIRMSTSRAADGLSAERLRMSTERLKIRLKEVKITLEQAENDMQSCANTRKLIYERQIQAYFQGYYLAVLFLNVILRKIPNSFLWLVNRLFEKCTYRLDEIDTDIYTDAKIAVISLETETALNSLRISGTEELYDYIKKI